MREREPVGKTDSRSLFIAVVMHCFSMSFRRGKAFVADCKLRVDRGLAKKRTPHDSCFMHTKTSTTRNCHGAKAPCQNAQGNHGAPSGGKSLRSMADLPGYSPAAISEEVRRNANKNGGDAPLPQKPSSRGGQTSQGPSGFCLALGDGARWT